jgi:hypothetical protein
VGFIGNFVDLTGYQFGSFTVQSLAGRDRQSLPRWTVVCGSCGLEQVFPHAKLTPLLNSKAADNNLRCANAGCSLSHTQRAGSESLVETRIRERREAQEAEKLAAQSAAEHEIESAEQRARQAKLAALKDEYRGYWLHQIKTRIAEDKILTLDEWAQLTQSTRQMILDRLGKDPTAYVEL